MSAPQYIETVQCELTRNAAVGRLAGGVAHDLNNIAMVISGFAGIINSSLPNDDKNREYLDHILEASERVSQLAERLQMMGLRQAIVLGPVDLRELLDVRAPAIGRSIDSHIELSFHCEEALPPVRAEQAALTRLFDHLVSNAADAMPNGGRLTIDVRRPNRERSTSEAHFVPEDYVEVEVRDTGVGIPRDTLNTIFEPFFTTKEKGKGAGLGLAIVCGILRQFDGQISCSSELGRGTSFLLALPVWDASVENTHA